MFEVGLRTNPDYSIDNRSIDYVNLNNQGFDNRLFISSSIKLKIIGDSIKRLFIGPFF